MRKLELIVAAVFQRNHHRQDAPPPRLIATMRPRQWSEENPWVFLSSEQRLAFS